MANQNDDRFDRVKTVAKAALAVGAGAAFLYRGGGNELLSKGLKRATNALNDSFNSVSKNSLRDLNGQAKKVFKEGIEEFKTSYKDYDDVKATLRLDNPNSLLNVFQIEHSLNTNPNGFLRKMYAQEEFIPGIKRELQNRLSDINPKRVNNIVDNILTHVSDTLEYTEEALPDHYKLSSKFKKANKDVLNEEQMLDLEEVIRENFIKKREETQQYINSHQDLLENLKAELLDYDGLATKFGTKNNQRQNMIEQALGDSQVTLRELVENADQIEKTNLISEGNQNPMDVLQRARELIEKDSRYGDLFVDKTLRIDEDGNIRSFAEAANIGKKFETQFLHTLPGKLLKPLETRAFKNSAPNFYFSSKGSVDYLLPKLLEDRESTILENSYFRINDRGFRVAGNELRRESKMDDLFLTSGTYGSHVRLYKNITGDVDYSSAPRSFIAEKLDMGSTPKLNAFENLKLKYKKFKDPQWTPNLIKDKINNLSADQSAEDYFEDMKEINRIFKRSTTKMDKTTVARLNNFNLDESTREIFDLLKLDDENLLKSIAYINTGGTTQNFLNADASSLINRYQKDPKAARSLVSISKKITNVGMNMEYTNADHYPDLLRKELSKEAFLRYKQAFGGDALMNMLNSVPLSNAQRSNAKKLASWGIFQEAGEIYNKDISPKQLEELTKSKTNLQSLFASELSNESNKDRLMKQEFQEVVSAMSKSASTMFDESDAPLEHLNKIEKANRPGSHIYVRKGISALDILSDLNSTEKLKAFGKQFTAGRKNMEDFTSYSFYPYFGLFRLTDALPHLAFSPENTGSVGDLAKNIMLKRVMPVIGAGYTLSYLNYESKNFTGKSLTEAAMVSWSNFDLGVRTFIDKTPLAESFKDMYYTNDLVNYYNPDPYRNVEEQREWYEKGVTPVRKGRWWGMSTSEFRGGKIEYFEPNKLRQVSTPWKDIGVYGSSDEKWKHSIIPTLRHPLSPIRYLMDPYWLEEKNKFSRPYPITAPLFSEGTPWSGILNMTVGNAIKPQRSMHNEVLGNDFTDVRDLILRENERIRKKDALQDRYVMLTGSSSATEERQFDMSGTPTLQGSPVIRGDNIDLSNFNKQSGVSAPYSVTANTHRTDSKITILDKLVMATMDTGMIMPQLEDINAQIKYKASTRGMSETNYAKQYDSLIAADTIDIVRDKDISAELRNTTSTKEYIRDIGYSAKQISGIYGFMFDELIPGKKQHILANASSMSSFSRSFWDESLGGVGGGFMEIARRFFPHANHDNIEVNPIRNSMPSWMPERFKHGDPYTKVKKGEMRLPGRAYEAMNHFTPNIDFSVHPYMTGASKEELTQYYINKKDMDEYFNSLPMQEINLSTKDVKNLQKNAKAAQDNVQKLLRSGKLNSGEFYDDFQRFKILADVAPYSSEYKNYKSIVQSQLTDANKKEYYDILERVKKQSTQHEFYNYRYTKNSFEEIEGYVDTITKDGFTLVGSNKTYALAGVKTTQEGISTQLAAGDKIRIKVDALDAQDDYLKAVVYRDGVNINREMIRDKTAERSSDGSAIDAHAIASNTQRQLGAIAETIGHLPIPIIHNRYMKLETPLEAYKSEQVYGTPYATWSHPIQGYIQPAFNKAVSVGPIHAALGATSFAANVFIEMSNTNFTTSHMIREAAELATTITGKKVAAETVANNITKAVKISNLLITPGAATGATIGFGIKLSNEHINKGAMIGSAIWSAGYLVTNANNPFLAVGAGASIGKIAGDFLETSGGKKGAAVGAAIGFGISYLRNPDFSIEGMKEKWIPKKTKKRWEMEEYFDRLNYIKYKGLFEKASEKALKKEGVNIKQLILEMEEKEAKNEKEKEKLLKYKQKLGNNYISNTEYGKSLMRRIDSQLTETLESKIVTAGEYTKSAIAYKQAMDSTIYGLKENASWAQILRALPKNDRDFFLEFAKVKDEKEQNKILATISPYKRKILQSIWGRKVDKLESNESYFSSYKLPNMFWEGWKPNVDMDQIQMKTIENEGMLLSDFGYYDSNKYEPGYNEVSPINNYQQDTSLLSLKANLFTSLNGLGLTGVNVSIEPSQVPGIQMIADFAKITDYRIKQKINQTFGRTYY